MNFKENILKTEKKIRIYNFSNSLCMEINIVKHDEKRLYDYQEKMKRKEIFGWSIINNNNYYYYYYY